MRESSGERKKMSRRGYIDHEPYKILSKVPKEKKKKPVGWVLRV